MDDFSLIKEDQAKDFISKNPHLEFSVQAAYEPPLGSYSDFTDSRPYPQNVVMQVMLYDGSEYHGFKNKEFYLRNDFLNEIEGK